jgi:hypothetical protein
MSTTKSRNIWPGFVACALVLVAAGMVVPESPGAFGRKKGCEVRQVFLQDVSIRRRSGVDTEEVLADYRAQLEDVLVKKKMTLVESLPSLGPGDVALRVSIRAWTDRTQNKRALLSLAATMDVDRAGEEIWSGNVAPGGASKLIHFRNSDPANLAKKTVDRLLNACRSDWSPTP